MNDEAQCLIILTLKKRTLVDSCKGHYNPTDTLQQVFCNLLCLACLVLFHTPVSAVQYRRIPWPLPDAVLPFLPLSVH